jgi:AraC family transcriptional regulator, transcriptional activator of the genes for pyochelin and ferripyochelin receptors
MATGDSILEQLIFSSREHGKIVCHQTKPAEGGVSIRARGKFGSMLVREVQEEGCSYRFYSFDVAEDMTLTSILDAQYLGILINFGTDVAYWQEGIRSGTLRKHQASLIHLPYLYFKSKFLSGHVYSFLDISFSEEHLKPWEKAFRSLNRIRNKAKKGIASFEIFDVTDGGRGITSMVNDINQMAVSTSSSGATQTKRINDLLFNLFDLYESGAQPIKLHATDIAMLNQVHDLLLHSPSTSVTLKELAHKAGMNEFKLKKGFKKLFGSPVYTFFVEARMKKAKALLAEKNLSVGEVALMVGYKSLSSFSAAFKKWFGHPPSSLK